MEEKNFVLILARKDGLFSLIFQVLGQAWLAEKRGAIPVVYFNRYCRYWSDAGYQGVRNVWEYYFEPLSPFGVTDLIDADLDQLEGFPTSRFQELITDGRVTVTDQYPEVIEWKSPYGIEFQRRFVHRLFQRHARLKPQVLEKLEAYCRDFPRRDVLGVHYRGIEKMRDRIIERNTADLKPFYFQEMERYLKRHPQARIFIATDSAAFLREARERFGETILFQEIDRLQENEEEIGLHNCARLKGQGARWGEDVLLDVFILSRTRFFIHGISNVAHAPLYLNPKLPHLNIDIKYGGTGIYLRREIRRRLSQVFPFVKPFNRVPR